MKKIIKLFSTLSLVTLILVGCSGLDDNNAQKIAKDFGMKLYAVDPKNDI